MESSNRIENIEELLNGVNDFIQQQSEIFEGDNSLSKYLQDVALYSETDKDIHSEKVSLMSIHMAKGLEFPIVYVVGLEENLFPSIMSLPLQQYFWLTCSFVLIYKILNLDNVF